MVYFNVHRVLAAVARQRQTLVNKNNVNYEILEEILESIKSVVDDQKYNFQQYVKAAENEGLTQAQTWKLAKETLVSHVSLRTLYRWAHEYLTEEAFMEVRQKASLNRKNIFADKWQQNLTDQIEGNNHIECESCVEAYEIDKIKEGTYTYEYLQSVAIWLHETLEIHCKGK